jgi:hypothetical protein
MAEPIPTALAPTPTFRIDAPEIPVFSWSAEGGNGKHQQKDDQQRGD